MKTLNLKAALPILTLLLMLFIVGCQEEAGTDSQKTRLLEDKNYRLTQKYEQQIKDCQEQLASANEALDQCAVKQAETEKQAEDAIGLLIETVIKDTVDKNNLLEAEKKVLEMEIEQLKAGVKAPTCK